VFVVGEWHLTAVDDDIVAVRSNSYAARNMQFEGSRTHAELELI